MKYEPQKITKALLRRLTKQRPPKTKGKDGKGKLKRRPKEIRDRSRSIILRHQPTGNLSLYAEIARGKRERICDNRDILKVLDEKHSLTLQQVFERAKILHGQAASGRDFASERNAQRAIPTLTEYLDETYEPWAVAERRSGDATIARLRCCFEKPFGRRRLTEITPARLAPWCSKRRNDGIRPETINRDLTALHAALGRAVRLEIIPKNPLSKIEKLEVDSHRQVVRALNATEKERLIKALQDRDISKRQDRASANEWRKERDQKPLPSVGKFSDVLTPAVIVSLETGVRRGDLFDMEWGKSVDLDARTIRVRGKTYESREIPLNKIAFETLRDWWLQCGQPNASYVFTNDGGRLGDLRRYYYPVLAAAGIKLVNAKAERITWHSLRHTFGSLLGAANVDSITLMKLMGHAKLTTTQRYLHTDQDRKREAVERLSAQV